MHFFNKIKNELILITVARKRDYRHTLYSSTSEAEQNKLLEVQGECAPVPHSRQRGRQC